MLYLAATQLNYFESMNSIHSSNAISYVKLTSILVKVQKSTTRSFQSQREEIHICKFYQMSLQLKPTHWPIIKSIPLLLSSHFHEKHLTLLFIPHYTSPLPGFHCSLDKKNCDSSSVCKRTWYLLSSHTQPEQHTPNSKQRGVSKILCNTVKFH